jgi:hypothetical protein
MSLKSSYQIGEVLRNALFFNIKNWVDGNMDSESLIQTVQNFFALLEKRQVEYVLVGGVAVLRYIEGRNTQDLDLLMALSSLEKLPELEVKSQDVDFVRSKFGELEIDILLTNNPLFNEVLSKKFKVERFLDRDIPIATVEGLLLLKLYALPSLYRQGNFAKVAVHESDVATLIYYYPPDTGDLLDQLSPYLSEGDLTEIRNIVADIVKRFQRFKKE